MSAERLALLADVRRALAKDHVALAIHDASFPSRSDEDTGRGSPYTRGARDFIAWAQDLGFDALQLGPQGETSEVNPSPYDGTVFAKSALSIALWPLVHDPAWEQILDARTFEAIVAGAPRGGARVDYRYAFAAHHRAVREAHARVTAAGDVAHRCAEFARAQASWLDHDARHAEGGADLFAFAQYVVHAQHAELLAYADARGLALFGDLQVGLATRDRLEREHLFLADYLMGAPPSRTNTSGQPWGYPVLDPRSDEALAFVRARVAKMLAEFHGIRIDHPHGIVCPWVYDAHALDPAVAVTAGARLYESPDLPELAAFALVRLDQLDRDQPRYADGWVRELDDAQVDAFARVADVIVDTARGLQRSTRRIMCEVLSTCPYPLARVLARHGLGRFRVTQKADPRNPDDVYRTDRAEPADWAMLGNHDTPPIWRVVARWADEDRVRAWCDYLEPRLPGCVDREAIARSPTALAQLMLVDQLVCDARNVSVFFADLIGATDIYNMPGVVSDANWSLRVGNDFAAVHAERCARGAALDLPRALATALRARGQRTASSAHIELANHLDRLGPAGT